jgi:hypothetical protein
MEPWLLVAVLVCLLAILFVLLYGFHKVRRFQRLMLSNVPGQMQNFVTLVMEKQFSQLEALAGIFIELGFKKSLPPTRGWAASPDFLREMHYMHYTTIRKSSPSVVVECLQLFLLVACRLIKAGMCIA